MPTLPLAIRNFFADGKLQSVTQSLVAKYGLRVDQAGVLERELMLLVMGLESPTEFVDTIGDEGNIDDASIETLVQDINELVFTPLRTEIERTTRRAAPIAPLPPRPVQMPVQPPTRPPVVQQPPAPTAQAPVPDHLSMPADMQPVTMPVESAPLAPKQPARTYIPIPQGIYTPPPQSPAYPTRENATAFIHHVAPIQIRRPINKLQPNPAASPARPASPAAPTAARPPETSASRMLEDHEEPSPVIRRPMPVTPPARPTYAPQNLPGSLPAVSIPNTPPAVSRPAPSPSELRAPVPTPTPRPSEPAVATPVTPVRPSLVPSSPRPAGADSVGGPRPYSSDPYREPIDDVK